MLVFCKKRPIELDKSFLLATIGAMQLEKSHSWINSMNKAGSWRLYNQSNKIVLSVLTFETAGAEHLAQDETNQPSNIVAVFVVVSSGVDMNSCSSIVSHAVAH